jgi:hypothetical protein
MVCALARNAIVDTINPAEFLDIDVGRHLKHALSATPSHVIAGATDRNLLFTEAFARQRCFLPWRVSDAGRPCPPHCSPAAGIRNPSQKRTFFCVEDNTFATVWLSSMPG